MPILTENQNSLRINNNVQSVLVSKFYNLNSAYRIIKELGYNTFGFHDDGGDYFRFRQFNPGSFRNYYPGYRTIDSSFKPGVKYIIEY